MLSSCSNTGPQTGTLSGTINLEGQSDHSNITIGVYKLAELDPDIVAINQEYPFIGVIINQHTEFDHRFGTLVKAGETDASGYFEINDIPTGIYNVVAIKDSFGFRYIYNVQINSGENLLQRKKDKDERKKLEDENSFNLLPLSFNLEGSKADLTLYPATIISADITTATIFESYHHYIIEQDIKIDDELTIEPGAVIRLNDRVKLTINGDLTAEGRVDNFIWFTSNDSIFSSSVFRFPSSVSLYEYNRVELDGTLNKEVAYCKFEHAGTGLLSKVNGFEISDCIFRESQCGFKVESVDSAFCSNLLCKDIYNDSFAGIYFNQVSHGLIKKNIIIDCEDGINIKVESSPYVINNYINSCNTGIDISFYSSSNIHNNEIYCFNYSIYIAHLSYPIIEKNNVNSTVGIGMFNFGDKKSEIHYNNLNCSIYAIKLRADHWTPIYYDVSAENNYYYTTNEDEIETLLYDKHDGHQFIEGEIIYKPYLTTLNIYSGIL